MNHQHHSPCWCLSIINICSWIYSLLCLSLLTLKSRFLFSFSLLQNNNLTRIPDQAFKNQRSLEVMYVRKWLPLVVVTIRYAFCTVTWEDHRFRVILSYWKEWPKVFQNQNIAYSFVIWKQLVAPTQANSNQLYRLRAKKKVLRTNYRCFKVPFFLRGVN